MAKSVGSRCTCQCDTPEWSNTAGVGVPKRLCLPVYLKHKLPPSKRPYSYARLLGTVKPLYRHERNKKMPSSDVATSGTCWYFTITRYSSTVYQSHWKRQHISSVALYIFYGSAYRIETRFSMRDSWPALTIFPGDLPPRCIDCHNDIKMITITRCGVPIFTKKACTRGRA